MYLALWLEIYRLFQSNFKIWRLEAILTTKLIFHHLGILEIWFTKKKIITATTELLFASSSHLVIIILKFQFISF